MMKHGSLFSGIGGFDLAAEWMGWENIFQVEIDPWCQKVLNKNFPNVKRYGDIKKFKGDPGSVDILSGGFPCQPFSVAGQRKGESDDRYLWPEYLRIIREIQPSYVVGENVAGLTSMEDGETLDGILSDLEGAGYETEQFIIPACGVGAWHRRDRIWIIAYNESRGRSGSPASKYGGKDGSRKQDREICSDVSDGYVSHSEGNIRDNENQCSGRPRKASQKRFNGNTWSVEPGVGRVANGIPNRVDRLKGLGNAIVPQVAYEIFKAIDILLN